MHAGDLKVAHLTHDFLHEFIHIDGKIWKTVLSLLIRPGLLTAEYWAGRRGQWIRPLRLYLVISALTLLLAPNAAGPLGFRIWKNGDAYHVGTNAPKDGTPATEEFNHSVQKYYLWIRYLSLGLFAAGSLALYRKLRPEYGAHLIFGLHFYSFEYLVGGLLARLWPDVASPVTVFLGFVYLFFSLRRAFGQKVLITFMKTVALFTVVAAAEVIVVAGSLLLVLRVAGSGHHG